MRRELPLDKIEGNGYHSKLSTLTHETQLVRNSNSLDQIQSLSEVYEDLREHKHANGKVFYVEDAKSEHSRNTEPGNDGVDEQSVIAMLDDVLDAEDSQLDQQQQQIFERNFSIDSELLPSVIETTIVATVHSSSSDDDDGASQQSLVLNRHEECRQMAQQMLDEMFDSEAFYEQLQVAQTNHLKEAELIRQRSQLKRVPSTASQASHASVVDDPLHSEKFKNRLSHLIMSAQQYEPRPRRQEEPAPDAVEVRPTRPQLKQSKSETDVRLLLLKAIRELKSDNEDDEAAAKETVAAAAPTGAATDGNGNANADEALEGRAGRIPRAPKFDPVLYKTINSISLHKQRPGLSRQLVLDAKNVNVAAPAGAPQLLEASTFPPATTTTSEPEPKPELEPLPFKAKLEAILQRGPSHRLQQQRPAADVVQRRRPQSTYIEEAAIE